jgi:transcription antitermination factor NusG
MGIFINYLNDILNEDKDVSEINKEIKELEDKIKELKKKITPLKKEKRLIDISSSEFKKGDEVKILIDKHMNKIGKIKYIHPNDKEAGYKTTYTIEFGDGSQLLRLEPKIDFKKMNKEI